MDITKGVLIGYVFVPYWDACKLRQSEKRIKVFESHDVSELVARNVVREARLQEDTRKAELGPCATSVFYEWRAYAVIL